MKRVADNQYLPTDTRLTDIDETTGKGDYAPENRKKYWHFLDMQLYISIVGTVPTKEITGTLNQKRSDSGHFQETVRKSNLPVLYFPGQILFEAGLGNCVGSVQQDMVVGILFRFETEVMPEKK